MVFCVYLYKSYPKICLNLPNCNQNLEVIELKPINQFIMTSLNTKPEPLPQPPKNLWGKQIYIFGLNTDNTKLVIIPEEKSHDK